MQGDNTEAGDDTGVDVDLKAALDRLVATGAVSESETGELEITADFEDVRGIYRDTYLEVDDDVFHRTVAELFGLDREAAADAVDENGVTREEVVAYLALRDFLEEPPDSQTLAVMARLLTELEPATPVPPELDDVTGDVDAFLAANPDALVTVWMFGCDPCDAMKADLDAVLDVVPDQVAVAGIAVERERDLAAFLREHDVDAAPAVVAFRDGEHRETRTGRQRPEDVREVCESVF